jgi:hypothetical protein
VLVAIELSEVGWERWCNDKRSLTFPISWSYQIHFVVILVFKVLFVSFYPQKPQEALNLLVTEERY